MVMLRGAGLLDFIREAEREALAKLGDEDAGIIESDLLFVSPMTGRHFHASSIGQEYIRPAGCCLVDCPNCGAVAGECARPTFPFRAGSAYRCTMSGGMLPASTAASVGTPSGVPTGPGWTTPEHQWECSRSLCGTPKSRPR